MEKQFTIRRIVWAVDPFAEDVELQRRTAETLCALAVDSRVEIEPVSIIHWEDRYVMSKEPLNIRDIQGAAVTSVEKMIQQFGVKCALSPTMLVQNDLSLGQAVKRLTQHAKDTKADLIGVGTQARKGATRFLLGSFAESLILQSDVPTLVVSPKTKPIKKIGRILYPTDLSEKSKEAFQSTINLAAEIGAAITVFHRVEYLTRGPSSLIPASPAYLETFKTDITRREKEAENLVALAKASGIDVDLIVQSQGTGTLEAILELAEGMDSAVIAMVSQSDVAESVLLGSITRQVIRHALCPVWVIHPKPRKTKIGNGAL